MNKLRALSKAYKPNCFVEHPSSSQARLWITMLSTHYMQVLNVHAIIKDEGRPPITVCRYTTHIIETAA